MYLCLKYNTGDNFICSYSFSSCFSVLIKVLQRYSGPNGMAWWARFGPQAVVCPPLLMQAFEMTTSATQVILEFGSVFAKIFPFLYAYLQTKINNQNRIYIFSRSNSLAYIIGFIAVVNCLCSTMRALKRSWHFRPFTAIKNLEISHIVNLLYPIHLKRTPSQQDLAGYLCSTKMKYLCGKDQVN